MVKVVPASAISRLELLATEGNTPSSVRVSLAAAINDSTRLASVNRLPPEILASVFAFSKTYCVCDDGFKINGLTGVCVYWRQIALETANLWTHVDVSLETPRELIDLLLSRSKNLPIHAHILNPEPQEKTVTEINNARTEYPIKDMMVALEPHIRRVCTLNIKSDTFQSHFVSAVLDTWSDRDSANSLRSLEVDRSLTWGVYVLWVSSQNKNIEKMLLGVNTLHLRSTVFEWDSPIYSGLVDLQLDFDDQEVSMLLWELANIFAACPALITLKLAELRVRDVADWIRPSPIVMKHLEVVNLTRMDPRHASSLLSLITLSGPRTELSVQISHTRELNDELASFFARSKITTLIHVTYTCEEDCDGCLTDQDCEGGIFRAAKFFPRYLPYTRTLVLENFDFYSPQVDQPAPPAPPSPLQSQLHTMFLVDCVVDFETLKRLVLEIGIQNLGLKRCTAGRPMSPNLRQELQTIQASLQEEYPHLRCWISEVDSTRQFECHTMLIPDYSFWKF